MVASYSLPPHSPLPPIQMPGELSTSTLRDGTSFSPTPSFAESFATAYTSPTQAATEDSPLKAESLLHPLQNLRKSISVDSFVQFGRDPPSIPRYVSWQSSASSTANSSKGRAFDLSTTLETGHETSLSGRNRGSSFSSIRDNEGFAVDSDVERSDRLNSLADRYRHTSFKAQDQSRPLIRGGELPLPSRTPTLSSTSSVSSIVSNSTNSSTFEDMPRQSSLPSLQYFPGHPLPSTTGVPGRVRSGSLGMYATTRRGNMLINTNVAPSIPAITLAVVGTAGCGKSVVIRKGLKGYRLSEARPIPVPPTQAFIKYSRRVSVIRDDNPSGSLLHVIEVDISTKPLDTEELNWPKGLPSIDGVIVCYDSSDEASFKPIEGLLRAHHTMNLPRVVLACKSDLRRQIEPERALEVLGKYDVGLVEVAKTQGQKDKMRRTFAWILKAITRDKRTERNDSDNYRNPASPDILMPPPPWEDSRTSTPTASSIKLSVSGAALEKTMISPSLQSPLPTTSPTLSISPGSPIRVRSTGDLLYENKQTTFPARSTSGVVLDTKYHEKDSSSLHGPVPEVTDRVPELPESKEGKDKEPRPGQWATLDELLDKLIFLAVSGDDPAYITHFLLTYRRFATPRSVLLAMQKRMRQLDNPSGDPMFACFAQMRICNLLEIWIRDYPHDFAVRGTSGALSALIKSIISKTYLLHYGSEFLPFLEVLPSLADDDAAWALKAEGVIDESDDAYSFLEDDEAPTSDLGSNKSTSPASPKEKPVLPLLPPPSRERKPSLPLPLILGSNLPPNQPEDTSEKQQIKDLVKLAKEVLTLDPDEIAQEITRVEVKLFLDIKPRHWLYYTFVSGKKDEGEPITAFNSVSNHLADWVVSLILCHKAPRDRVKQIEKFVEIAQRLRTLNNYSALRAFVAGINNATFSGDETMELFKVKCPEQAKSLRSWDLLLQHIRSHRAYRLALRNSKGACIPALEVHMSDLIRAHEGNDDFDSSDTTKIHWGKFNMMGRFISSTAQCQAQCRVTTDYNFPDRSVIRELFIKRPVMNDQMKESRLAPMDTDTDDYRPISHPTPTQPRDAAILRKLFFW